MANFFSETDKFVEYKYTITEMMIMIGGESEKFPLERIKGFKIEHHYEEASFPLFRINLSMEPSRYYKIIKNKEDIKFKLRIQYYYTELGEEKKSMLKDLINEVFIVYLDDSSEDYERELKKEAKTDKDENELDKINNEIELFLFKPLIVNGLRSNFNAVLTDCDMATSVTYLLSKANVKNLLMSPFDNTKSYGEILLPPQSIENQLKFLNNNFGFHKNGTMIYFGLFHNYILNYSSGCTAWAKKEWKETVIYILDKTNTKGAQASQIIKQGEERYYLNLKTEALNIENSSISGNVLNGVDTNVLTTENSDSSNLQSGAKVVGQTTSKSIVNTSSNPYLGSAFIAQQKASAIVLSIILEGFDIQAFNPNKNVSIIFESATLNSKYKGNYKVSNAYFIFTGTRDNYGVKAYITLKKVG